MRKGVPQKRKPFHAPLKSLAAFRTNDRGIGYDFWLLHGVNYLSDNPFPGLYRGDQIYRSVIFSYITEKYLVGDVLTPQGRKCLTWASTLPDELYRSVLYVKAFARKYKRDPYQPNDPYVRVGIETVATLMVSGQTDWGKGYDTVEDYYRRYQGRYNRDMSRAAKAVLAKDPRTREGWEFWADIHRLTIKVLGLPPKVKPFRLEYVERKDRGYLVGQGWMEERRKERNSSMTNTLTEDEEEELERRVRAHLEEEGEDPDSDSDHAMYLRQDIAAMILQERERKNANPSAI